MQGLFSHFVLIGKWPLDSLSTVPEEVRLYRHIQEEVAEDDQVRRGMDVFSTSR